MQYTYEAAIDRAIELTRERKDAMVRHLLSTTEGMIEVVQHMIESGHTAILVSTLVLVLMNESKSRDTLDAKLRQQLMESADSLAYLKIDEVYPSDIMAEWRNENA